MEVSAVFEVKINGVPAHVTVDMTVDVVGEAEIVSVMIDGEDVEVADAITLLPEEMREAREYAYEREYAARKMNAEMGWDRL